MNKLTTKTTKRLKNLTLAAILIVPFFLYYAAINDMNILVDVLLGVMGSAMLLAIKVG